MLMLKLPYPSEHGERQVHHDGVGEQQAVALDGGALQFEPRHRKRPVILRVLRRRARVRDRYLTQIYTIVYIPLSNSNE